MKHNVSKEPVLRLRGKDFAVPEQPIIEVGMWEHEGHRFEAAGSVVSELILVGYPKGDTLMTWDGTTCLARLRMVGRARGFQSTMLYCYQATTPDGKRYHGRGLGEGMVLRLRRNA